MPTRPVRRTATSRQPHKPSLSIHREVIASNIPTAGRAVCPVVVAVLKSRRWMTFGPILRLSANGTI
jgi:hypothetical protein